MIEDFVGLMEDSEEPEINTVHEGSTQLVASKPRKKAGRKVAPVVSARENEAITKGPLPWPVKPSR